MSTPATVPKEDTRPFKERHRKGYEATVLATIVLGAVLGAGGSVAASFDEPEAYLLGMTSIAAGLVLVTASMLLSYRLDTLRVSFAGSSGGDRYDQLKYWTRLKAAGILLNILAVVTVIVLLASLMFRIEPFQLTAPFPIILRSTTLLTVILVGIHTACHYLSLRTPIERPPGTGLEGIFVYLGAAGTLAFAIFGAVLGSRPINLAGLVLKVTDAPFFLLASVTFASVTLFVSRNLPNVYSLFSEERTSYTGHRYLSRSKSVLMPAMMALALLFLVVLVLFVLGFGLVGIIEEVPRNTILIGVFGFILAALLVSVAMTVVLSRSEDRATLYRKKRSAEQMRSIFLLAGSLVATALLFLISGWLATGHSVLGLAPSRWTDFLSFGLLAALGPYGFYIAARYRRIRRLEERFPDFLRDLAASRKAGLTLPASVTIASQGEYGALTPEIVKMADQLSWDVPFDEALQRFGDRVNTPLVQRAVSLIIEASHSGGNVTDVLLAAAQDAREIKNLENERITNIGLYTVIIYIAFFVFLGVAAVLYGTFVPEVLKTGQAAAGANVPGVSGLTVSDLSLEEYRVFYFLSAVVMALGNGLVAGMMGAGRALDGLRHSFVMVLISWMVFAVMLAPGA